jgi:hypothetical protein
MSFESIGGKIRINIAKLFARGRKVNLCAIQQSGFTPFFLLFLRKCRSLFFLVPSRLRGKLINLSIYLESSEIVFTFTS